jgi:1-phosphatidylinositol phosphodiesterase
MALLAVLGSVGVARSAAAAAMDDAYSHDFSAGESHADWMSALPDELRLSDLSVPGTHDSGASRAGGDITLTQSMSLPEQLNAGIRALDLRVGSGPACPLSIFHGIICQRISFSAIVNDLERFLTDHPGETLIVRLKKEHGSPDPAAIEALLAGRYYNGRSSNPTLGAVRGRIVLLVDGLPKIGPLTWNGDNQSIQDHYALSNNWQLAAKWQHYVLPQLQAAGRASASQDTLFINFTSASGGGFPYFFASGNSSPATHSPGLATGWTRGRLDTCAARESCLAEYPSHACVLGTCTVVFAGLNALTRNYIENSEKRTGIVFSDFPGRALIAAIIATNPTSTSRGGP